MARSECFNKTVCPTCGSDDLMRHVAGGGVEYGYDWVIEHFVKVTLDYIDEEACYEELLDDVYPDNVNVCGFSYTPSYILKNLDPTAWRCGLNDWIDSALSDGILFDIDGGYYRYDEIEDLFSKGIAI